MNALVEVKSGIEKMQGEFAKTLPAHISPEKFVRTAVTALQLNPQVAEADRRSLYGACMRAAQDGLVLDGREAALVVHNTKSGKVATYMPMIAGIMKKVRNSGEIATWSVQAVYERDQFNYELGDNESITHKPALTNRGKVVAFYSIVTLKTGEKSREVMSVEEVEAIRARSRASGSGPWVTDFAEMGKKTVARRHSKRLPMSSDLDDMMRADDGLYQQSEPVDVTPAAPTPEAEKPAKKETRAAKVVKAKAEQPEHDAETGEAIEADYQDVVPEEDRHPFDPEEVPI